MDETDEVEKVRKLYKPREPDVYVTCPYFPEHKLRRSRLPYHLMKCSKNPKGPVLFACPFNFLHRVPNEDRLNHVFTCEDRPMKYNDRESPSYGKTIKSFGPKNVVSAKEWNNPLPEEEEEWWP